MNPFKVLRRSLSTKLLFVFLLTAVVVVTLISMTWGVAARFHFQHKIRPHILQYVDYVSQDLGNPPSKARAREISQQVPVNIHIVNGDERFSSINEPLETGEIDFDDDDKPGRRNVQSPSGLLFDVGSSDDRTLIRTRIGEYTVYYEVRHDSFRRDRSHKRRGFGHDRPGGKPRVLFLCTLALLLGALGACYWAIRRLLKPVWEIRNGVRRMGKGELEYRIPVRRADDLGELSTSINTMAGDIQQMLDAKRDMLLGISHELRSPITRAKISAELLEASTGRERITEDLREMESLVTELLESERLNSSHSVLNLSELDPHKLVATVVDESFSGRVRLQVQNNGPVMRLDETRMRLLLRNLIANAVHYGGDTTPRVSCSTTNNIVTVIVSDEGDGIAPEHIAHLTEPFYRADPARTRATGGFGLGLYLARLICEAHNGELNIQSEVGQGTTITATLSSQA